MKATIKTTKAITRQAVESMKSEHAEWYDQPHGFRRLDGGVVCGYTATATGGGYWTTSSGNQLAIESDPAGGTLISISGRRHGIPWRFINRLVEVENLQVIDMQSQASAPPWCDGSGKPLVRFGRQIRF